MVRKIRALLICVVAVLLALAVMRADTEIIRLKAQQSALRWQLNGLAWQVNSQLIENIKVLQKSVIFIEVGTPYGKGTGSGVIIGPNTILTAKHVVVDADYVIITDVNGNDIRVIDIEIDPDDDCAIITVNANLLNFVAPASEVIVGERVIIIGAPFGIDFYNTVTAGIVSGLNRDVPFFGVNSVITVDAASNPGNSGGPVFNMRGQLIGILVGGKWGADGFSIVVTVETVREFLDGRII